jgi:hypothetical protein
MVGTWQDSEEHFSKEEEVKEEEEEDKGGVRPRPSNVTLLSRAINQISTNKKDEKCQQIVYYQAGIGTSLSYLQRAKAGAFGLGHGENVREAYGFICHNWQEGDEYLRIMILKLTDVGFTSLDFLGVRILLVRLADSSPRLEF